MNILEGFSIFKDNRKVTKDRIIKLCPSCKQEFFKDDEHNVCNHCNKGFVWNGVYYDYYSELDSRKQMGCDV